MINILFAVLLMVPTPGTPGPYKLLVYTPLDRPAEVTSLILQRIDDDLREYPHTTFELDVCPAGEAGYLVRRNVLYEAGKHRIPIRDTSEKTFAHRVSTQATYHILTELRPGARGYATHDCGAL